MQHLDLIWETERKGQRTTSDHYCTQEVLNKENKSLIYLVDIADFYSPAMMGLKTDQEVLGELVKAKAPAVGQLMAQYPGIWTLVVSRWFICLYIDILPIEVRKRSL